MTRYGFDRLAKVYQWMEYASFGPYLRRCRMHHLARLRSRTSALVLGDGDGRFTAGLLREAAGIHVTAIDGSGSMLQELQRRCGAACSRLTTHQALLPAKLPPLIADEQYDLVATHFFLDCLTTAEVEQLARAVRPHMQSNGVWVVSDFAAPNRAAGAVVAALYAAFRLLTGLRTQVLPDHTTAMRTSGFSLLERHTFLRGLLFTEVWQPSASARERLESDIAL